MSASGPSSESPAAYVLLAAGGGRRFGPGKLTVDLAGKPVWRWAADGAVEAGMTDIRVITNDPAIAGECAALGWTAVPNPDAATGIASSLRLAAAAAIPGGVVVIALADMPFVPAGHLRRLAAAQRTAFTKYPDGRPGVPAAFSCADCNRLKTLEGDRGAAALPWPEAAALAPPNAETLFDIDTPDALERARAIAVRLARGACR